MRSYTPGFTTMFAALAAIHDAGTKPAITPSILSYLIMD
jgi:hypothetical protein